MLYYTILYYTRRDLRRDGGCGRLLEDSHQGHLLCYLLLVCVVLLCLCVLSMIVMYCFECFLTFVLLLLLLVSSALVLLLLLSLLLLSLLLFATSTLICFIIVIAIVRRGRVLHLVRPRHGHGRRVQVLGALRPAELILLLLLVVVVVSSLIS